MNIYEVKNIYSKIKNQTEPLKVTVPGSKSITNRAMLLAALTNGECDLKGALFSDDSRHFLKCLSDLGFKAEGDEERAEIKVTGCGGAVPLKEASVYVGSAGTAARFLTAYLAVSDGVFHLDASEQMRKRPMAPLLDTLKEMGAEINCEEKEGYFPFTITKKGRFDKPVSVDIKHSSQFLSALLISSVCSDNDVVINLKGIHGMSYIKITTNMMKQFGVIAEQTSETSFLIKKGQQYNTMEYQIEPDVSAASYFYAMAMILGVKVIVKNVFFSSMQGDIEFLKILEKMGAVLEETKEGILINPPKDKKYNGITADMSACSDQAITLAAVAVFAQSPTTITGIGHIRFQESDRIAAIAKELTKMGIKCEEKKDSITIYPSEPKPCQVETYDDHRMAMGFSLIGLRADGIKILDPLCCRKTFENYFEVLDNVVEELI